MWLIAIHDSMEKFHSSDSGHKGRRVQKIKLAGPISSEIMEVALAIKPRQVQRR